LFPFLFQFVDKPLFAYCNCRFERAQMHCCQLTVIGGAYSRCPKLVRFVDKGLSPEKTRPRLKSADAPCGFPGGLPTSPAPVDP
jgi:hypothetical protein